MSDLTWAFLSCDCYCILLRTRWVGLLRALWAQPTVEALQLCFFYIPHNCTMLLDQMPGCCSRWFCWIMVQLPIHSEPKPRTWWNFNMFWMVLTMMTDSCYEKLILAMLSQKSRMCRPRSVALPRSSKVSNILIASLEKLLKSIARFHNCEANEFWKDFHKLPFPESKWLRLLHQT